MGAISTHSIQVVQLQDNRSAAIFLVQKKKMFMFILMLLIKIVLLVIYPMNYCID